MEEFSNKLAYFCVCIVQMRSGDEAADDDFFVGNLRGWVTQWLECKAESKHLVLSRQRRGPRLSPCGGGGLALSLIQRLEC
eukprot:1158157-Pelagomonas_calceolata.AAC.8